MRQDIPGFWFLSFANSRLGGRIRNPLKRIRHQAEEMGVFGNRIRVWTEMDLDSDFLEAMKDHLTDGSRGYGYWCWKPQIVLQLLREMNERDVLLYADAGCHLNPRGIERLKDYYDLAMEHGVVAFQARLLSEPGRHLLLDGEWCKGDLLDYFGLRDDRSITQTGQFGGTTFLVRKDRSSEMLFSEFKRTMTEHFNLCDDSPSVAPNLPCFIENRHDQSVFSLLGKKHGVFSLSAMEYSTMDEGDSWVEMLDYPIWAKHDKGGVRSLFPGWLKRMVHFVSKGKI